MDKNLSADFDEVEVKVVFFQGSVRLGGYDTTTELNNEIVSRAALGDGERLLLMKQ